MERFDVAIVGTGHGGAAVAIALRQQGFAGSIVMIGDEPDPPYERPPLSKDYLSGDRTFERILIRPSAFWIERRIKVLPGIRIASVDPDQRMLASVSGTRIAYETLIWAGGGRARRLGCDGHDLSDVHTIRTRADVDRLAANCPASNGSSSSAAVHRTGSRCGHGESRKERRVARSVRPRAGQCRG